MTPILNRSRTLLLHSRANRQRGQGPARRWTGIAAALTGALAAAGAAFVAALILLPPSLVFPVTAAGLVLAAATTALIALASPTEIGGARVVYWDVAGTLTLIGLCAALFGEPEQAVALLERERI
jgi:predicted benzoate:H+ symporter BenE